MNSSIASPCSTGTGLSPLAILLTNDGGTERCAASAAPLPLCSDNHICSDMGGIIFPTGESNAIPHGEFDVSPACREIPTMQTVEETRRKRLQLLVDQEGGLANLCQRLGLSRKETSGLSRILNANIRHDRDGKPYVMGSPMAREIEVKLNLATGWMDTPLNHAEFENPNDPRALVMSLMEGMPPDEWAAVVRVVDALAQPAKKLANER